MGVSCDAIVNRSRYLFIENKQDLFWAWIQINGRVKYTSCPQDWLVVRNLWYVGTVYRTGRREEFTFFEETRNILDLSSTIDILKWISKNCFWIKTVNDFYHAIFTVTEATGLEDTEFFFDNIVVRSALFCPPIHTKESNHNWQFYVFQNRNNW